MKSKFCILNIFICLLLFAVGAPMQSAEAKIKNLETADQQKLDTFVKVFPGIGGSTEAQINAYAVNGNLNIVGIAINGDSTIVIFQRRK